ncbi:MAG: protein adenylyltransferase SelO [Chitinophagales bacterium]|nr:YdiU family protein [Sphingobacteriales bacterium]
MKFNIDHSFIKSLPADVETSSKSRQVEGAAFSYTNPLIPSYPNLIHYSDELATECGFSQNEMQSEEALEIFSGTKVYPNTQPYSMCYGGHQFGHWAGQLGDGRAINLFEHLNAGKRYAFQLKGAGPTPYSRKADGLAVLRSSIREYLCSEAMYHLGIPTTRALSLVTTGDLVWRDMMYDGHPIQEKGAIVCRVAPSFIRFGNFELFTSRKDLQNLKRLADYTIQYFYPHITGDEPNKYLALFQEITDRTLNLMLDWQRVGFVHGVMNTDNMSILGLTIDYGPYGWLEDYNPDWTPNTTDAEGKRYRFGNQPDIAFWNLIQLANALYPLIENVHALEEILNGYQEEWGKLYPQLLANKLGFKENNPSIENAITELEPLLKKVETDYTIFYRQLAHVEKEMEPMEIFELISLAFYRSETITESDKNSWLPWIQSYLKLVNQDTRRDAERREYMNTVNPKYVLRNYMAQLAIDAAEKGDYTLIDELYRLLKKPYEEQPEMKKWYTKRPDWAREKVGCSMLSCSS